MYFCHATVTGWCAEITAPSQTKSGAYEQTNLEVRKANRSGKTDEEKGSGLHSQRDRTSVMATQHTNEMSIDVWNGSERRYEMLWSHASHKARLRCHILLTVRSFKCPACWQGSQINWATSRILWSSDCSPGRITILCEYVDVCAILLANVRMQPTLLRISSGEFLEGRMCDGNTSGEERSTTSLPNSHIQPLFLYHLPPVERQRTLARYMTWPRLPTIYAQREQS